MLELLRFIDFLLNIYIFVLFAAAILMPAKSVASGNGRVRRIGDLTDATLAIEPNWATRA